MQAAVSFDPHAARHRSGHERCRECPNGRARANPLLAVCSSTAACMHAGNSTGARVRNVSGHAPQHQRKRGPPLQRIGAKGGRFPASESPQARGPPARRASGHAPGRGTARGGRGPRTAGHAASRAAAELLVPNTSRAGGRAGPPSPAIARARHRAQLVRLPGPRSPERAPCMPAGGCVALHRLLLRCFLLNPYVLRLCTRCPSAIDG